MLPIPIVTESLAANEMLNTFINKNKSIALVVDEFGGTSGLVTSEDVTEEIVGEIEDEHDLDDDNFWILEESGKYLVKARAPLREFCIEAKRDLTESEQIYEEEIDTLGGLICSLIGRVPGRGECIRHESGIEFEIIDGDARRIRKVKIRGLDENKIITSNFLLSNE